MGERGRERALFSVPEFEALWDQFEETDRNYGISVATRRLYRNGVLAADRVADEMGFESPMSLDGEGPLFRDFFMGMGTKCSTVSTYANVFGIVCFTVMGRRPRLDFRCSAKSRKREKVSRNRRYMTQDEIGMLLAYRDNSRSPVAVARTRAIIQLLVDTGLRSRELESIGLSDIDLDECSIFVETTKTEPRTVYFSSNTSQGVQEYFDMILPPNAATSFQGRLFGAVRTIRKDIQTALQSMGLYVKGRGAHTLRHYAASHMVHTAGISKDNVAALLGTTVKILETHYIHPVGPLGSEVRKKMGWKGD